MSDKLVFDLAQEIEGSPNVFVRKDWINILDNQNQNYNNNQSVLDTSQLSNSNKYMSYREAYLSVPMVLTYGLTSVGTSTTPPVFGVVATQQIVPNITTTGDYCIGLKNWFGQIIHSFTLDYNGVTIIQQTPYINMWNSFKLMTSFSLNDVSTQGDTIGFYPDNPLSFFYVPTAVTAGAGVVGQTGYSTSGCGTINNQISQTNVARVDQLNNFSITNYGYFNRQQVINYDCTSQTGSSTPQVVNTTYASATYNSIVNQSNIALLWKSYVLRSAANPITFTSGSVPATGTNYIQFNIVATIYLKHIHGFFNMCPLLKGVFMKMTMNLNNSSSTILYATNYATGAAGVFVTTSMMNCLNVSNAVGGINPILVASASASNFGGGSQFLPVPLAGATQTCTTAGTLYSTWVANISVGSVVLNSSLTNAGVPSTASGMQSKSIYLYIPSYTFNPIFEQSYLSSPIKQIKYTDVYQYQVLNIGAGSPYNNLITNGIANIKSILVLPFYSVNGSNTVVPCNFGVAAAADLPASVQSSNNVNTGFLSGTPVYQSPFDPAGSGCTSPIAALSNFNIQISGQNAIYNIQRYNFEAFNNQLYGQNAVNGGLTDGITSSLINRQSFDMEYCYYYVNVERMLPVEQSVPKSVQIIGQNFTTKLLDLYVFVEYGNEISIDALTGARV